MAPPSSFRRIYGSEEFSDIKARIQGPRHTSEASFGPEKWLRQMFGRWIRDFASESSSDIWKQGKYDGCVEAVVKRKLEDTCWEVSLRTSLVKLWDQQANWWGSRRLRNTKESNRSGTTVNTQWSFWGRFFCWLNLPFLGWRIKLIWDYQSAIHNLIQSMYVGQDPQMFSNFLS